MAELLASLQPAGTSLLGTAPECRNLKVAKNNRQNYLRVMYFTCFLLLVFQRLHFIGDVHTMDLSSDAVTSAA